MLQPDIQYGFLGTEQAVILSTAESGPNTKKKYGFFLKDSQT